jgi:membrane associated rhomboid family serine protease
MIKELKKQFRAGNNLTKLIYINISVFVLIKFFGVFAFLMQTNTWDIINWFALPAEVTKIAQKPWSFISYMFVHQGFLHILFNLLWLFFGGQIFLQYLNNKQLLSTYVLGGIFGAFSYVVAFNTFPVFQQNLYQSMAIGASASVLAIVTAIATYTPNYSVQLTLIGRVKLKHIAIFSILLDILSIPKGNAGGHIAHLGGALYGFLYIQQLKSGKDWSKSFDWLLKSIFHFFKKKPSSLKKVYNRPKNDDQWRANKAAAQEDINRILDKISKSGYESLNKQEKETLFKASKK